MKAFKVLHIAYWYPNDKQPQEGLFIKNHIDALDTHCENEVYHIQVKQSKNWFKRVKTSHSTIFYTRLAKYYRIQEWLTFWVLFRLLITQKKAKNADIVNFHIATPLCRYLNFFQSRIRKKIVVTEHWSAYHHFFGLPKDHHGLKRIKSIFHKDIEFITVSNALAKDLVAFSGNENLSCHIVPNVVDTDFYNFKVEPNSSEIRFFMATNWSQEKKPDIVLAALARLKSFTHFDIYIAGDGPTLPTVKQEVRNFELKDQVHFLGRLNKEQMAEQYQKANFFLSSSRYETFSVVCAESLCCGCPVITSDIPAIKEYLIEDAALTIPIFDRNLSKQEAVDLWFEKLKTGVQISNNFNRQEISKKYTGLFGKEPVSHLYFETLVRICGKS